MAFQAHKRLSLSLIRATRLANTTIISPAATSRSILTTTTTTTTTPLCRRLYSSSSSSTEDAPPPPLLQKLKADLKTAMRAKDAARLTVLRSILSATLNASKTASPVATDAQLVALLRKTARASRDAAAEFRAAGRADLADQEQAQIDVLDAYAAGSGVRELGPDALRAVVADLLARDEELAGGGKAQMGNVMKKLLAPGGPLEGASVEKAELAKIVKEVVG